MSRNGVVLIQPQARSAAKTRANTLSAGTAGIAYDPNYHAAGDNYTNLNFEAFLVNTQAIAAAIAEYGTSFDSLPAANTTTKLKTKRSEEAKQRRRSTNKRSCGHKPTW
jgi:hypothetical protein